MTGAPFTDECQLWCDRAVPRSTRTDQISSECVHCVGFRWPKTTILGKFWHFGGLLYLPPFTDEVQMWCAIADPQCTLTCQISSRSVYSVAFSWRKTPIFALFWTSTFSVVANWQQSDKVEHRYTTTNLPLSNGIDIISVLQRLHSEIWRTTSDIQDCDELEQTNRQTDRQKNSTFLAGPAADEIRAQPNLAWW